MRKLKQKVTDNHVERVLALDAVAGVLNYQDMTPEEAKSELFAMGERGEGPPHRKHPLGPRWESYTRDPKLPVYDHIFFKEHRKRFPHWYAKRIDLLHVLRSHKVKIIDGVCHIKLRCQNCGGYVFKTLQDIKGSMNCNICNSVFYYNT